MMEIYEQRRRRSGRMWLVPILLIFAVVIWSMYRNHDTREHAAGDLAPAGTLAQRPLILLVATRRYLDFAKQAPDFGDISRAHDYTSTGLRYLAGALEEVSSTPANRARIAALRATADELGEKPTVAHAQIVAVTFKQAADALAEVQRTRFPALNGVVAQVQNAAAAIIPNEPLLQQSDRIRAFFGAAATVLERMGAAPPSTDTARER